MFGFKNFIKKNWIFLSIFSLAAILLTHGIVISNTVDAPASTTVCDWGIAFDKNNEPPRGNVSAEELKKNNAYFIGDTEDKTIYLTFDAGYENGQTAQILDTLKKHEVKAAFFIVSHYIKTAPELVKRMVEEGHIVANHTSTHPDMSKISTIESFTEELTGIEERYKELTGEDMPKFYRPPQGKFSEMNLEFAKQLGYTTVFWSLAYKDWDTQNQPSKEYALDKLNSRIHNGSIVLLHSTSQTNADILDELLTGWKEQGYIFGTLYDFESR
ncbi:MAG: delta-lactam-biosynthetic de-N-acetylase [Clostridia bacterium]|nr:delta-lactam-biosynthetic de-N-acetylase [Clostridia bacterium]